MDVIGYYKKSNIVLVEKDGEYFVVDQQTKKVLYRGDEEICTKTFILIAANFIEKETLL